jgi:peptidoglycan hydrolase CwlO-like protein
MNSDLENELLEKIEGLRDELQSVNDFHAGAIAEVQKLREQLKKAHLKIRDEIRNREDAEDRLRAAQSQGAV